MVGPEDDEEELKATVMEDMADIFDKVDKGGEGVCVQASTLGSLEALLSFLSTPEVNIPVAGASGALAIRTRQPKAAPRRACAPT